MFGSLHIGRMFGINVFVHGTFWLLPALMLFSGVAAGQTAELPMNLAVLFGIFGCVALHEFGHAIAASWYGIRTRDITLYPIGGVARLENMPHRPLPEIVVALAGPAVNVVIAMVLAAVLFVDRLPLAPSILTWPPMAEFAVRLLEANVVLVVFNLIPAFPMDGGRVLRAVLHMFMNRVSATEGAAGVGAVVAGLLFLAGLTFGNVMLSVLAVVVFLLGRAELMSVRHEDREQRRQAKWDDEPWDEPRPRPRSATRVVIAQPIDGWEWDEHRQTWVEYRGGFPVREWTHG